MDNLTQPPHSLEDILREFQHGRDREGSFRVLFTHFYPQVQRFFRRKGVPPEDCRDLTQEVFLSVYKGLGSIHDASSLPNWLFTIARNVFVNDLEKKHAKKRSGIRAIATPESEEVDLDVFPSRAGHDALRSMLDREKTVKLTEALGNLPQQMRRCVQLRLAEDCTYDEISTIMGISVNTVKAHLHKARKVLQEQLSPYFEDIQPPREEDR